ncbi:hypothetical protein [Arthrobacter sp.]|uniref:hypothetical protein n=1 Tax=Arthrobacter sp. TaxID=1667 RepID=UPI003392E758
MKGKLMFGAGLALGFVLGSKSGRSAYDSLKTKGQELWHNPTVQDKVHEATEAVKDKAPGVAEQLTEAAKKAGSAAASKLPGKHGTDDVGASTGTTATDTVSDPALNDQTGQNWTGEGGAMPSGPATSDNDDLRPPGPGV